MAESGHHHQSPHTTSSRTFARVPSATSLLPPTSAQGLTAADLLSHQALLESQAREAIPFSYTLASCTYAKGYIRQPLWACKDCGGGAVCAGCSIGCHADHELVELFAKRNIRCDCGTLSLQRNIATKDPDATLTAEGSTMTLPPCNLRASPLNFAPQNDLNLYGKNYDGHFCYCEKGYTYDPMEEEETMFQCLVCEDWLHETCVSLRPRRGQTKTTMTTQSTGTGGEANGKVEDPQVRDEAKDTVLAQSTTVTGTSSQLLGIAGLPAEEEQQEDPPPLISHDSFDNVICDACVRSHPILLHYIGAPAWGACLRVPSGEALTTTMVPNAKHLVTVQAEDGERKYLVLGLPLNTEYTMAADSRSAHVPSSGTKRELSPIVEGEDGCEDSQQPAAKRAKPETKEAENERPASPPLETSSSASVDKSLNSGGENVQSESSSSECKLPPIHPMVERLLSLPATSSSASPHPNNPGEKQRASYRLDVYLDEGNLGEEDSPDPLAAAFYEEGQLKGFRKQICRCPKCLEAFKDLPFLLEEEETYSPPASQSGHAARAGGGEQDDDARSASSHSSTYDLGLDALNRLPRAQTLEAMEGYGRLRTALFEHLRPFAQSGRTVDEGSIRRFFEEQRARDREGR